MLGVFAGFEPDLREEGQADGIAKAKAAGVYKCRPAELDPAEVRRLKAEGVKPAHIAKRLGISRDSVYRFLKADPEETGGDTS